MGIGRLLLSLLALAAWLGALTASASAGPELCPTLEAQLAVAAQQAAHPWDDGADDISRAIARQRNDLDEALSRARRAGCAGGFFNERKGGKCGALNATTKKMRANLNRLNAQRRRIVADPYAGEQQRSALLRELAANGCGQQFDAYEAGAGRRARGFFTTVFGGQGRVRDIWRQDDGYDRGFTFGNSSGAFSYGTFRTLCVRTCDGYYFPISFATGPGQFGQDEMTCQAMCPGTGVALYVHRNPGEDANAMMSLAGQPYTSLPTAFRYRREYDGSCKCGAVVASADGSAQSYSSFVTIGEPPPPEPAAPVAHDPYADFIPVPPKRPAPSDDPETIANRAGSLPLGDQAEVPEAVAGIGRDGKPVRVVGPSYYYVSR